MCNLCLTKYARFRTHLVPILRSCPKSKKNADTLDIGITPPEKSKLLPKIIKTGIFIKGKIKNLDMEDYECHLNSGEYAYNRKNHCVFFGFGRSKLDGHWFQHSWVVDMKGIIKETWWDEIDAYYGVPDKRGPKKYRQTCNKIEKILRKKDKTEGCKIKY